MLFVRLFIHSRALFIEGELFLGFFLIAVDLPRSDALCALCFVFDKAVHIK